jgi:hypothetical protein
LVRRVETDVGAATVPNLTLGPGTKWLPVIFMALPLIPEVGVRPVMVGGPQAYRSAVVVELVIPCS